ncbi:hypothetical protein MJL48_33535 [Salmonella enterica subsp. enterica serovar Kentucky]|nr:hypothetical protein [Salmonella enterica subsp. enterica serovar Kentucky]
MESAYSREHNCLKASSGWTALYIHPGYGIRHHHPLDRRD